MLVSKIDYNMLSEIMTTKEVVRESIEAVIDEKITAIHLATDVYALLDLLDKLENDWKGTPPEEDVTLTAVQAPPVVEQAPIEQTPPVVEQAPVEQLPPVVEQAPVEQPPVEEVNVEEPYAEQIEDEVPPAENEQ